MTGISFITAVGKWAKPTIGIHKTYWYLNTGFISFTLLFEDFEEFMVRLMGNNRA